jgi:hypothetical protein
VNILSIITTHSLTTITTLIPYETKDELLYLEECMTTHIHSLSLSYIYVKWSKSLMTSAYVPFIDNL